MKTKRPKRTIRVIWSDQEFEAGKATCRNLDHDEAVQEVAFLQRRYRQQWSGQMAESPVDLNVVLKILVRKRIPFVLTGAYGIASWTGRPRSTQDVDILVKPGRNYTRAVNAIKALYPTLEMNAYPMMTRFYIPGEKESVIDIVCPLRADNEETLANPTWTRNDEGLRYRIPSLEEALANKYGAMLSPTRSLGKRTLDMADFIWMVTHSLDKGRQPIDLRRLKFLGEKVWPGGGGEEILRLVEQVKAGKATSLDSLG
jgi:hypothetical protein